MTEIVKWKQLYKVVFKEEWEVKLISPEQFDSIKKKLFKNEWIEVDNELYNPFEIKKIVKYQTQDWIVAIINKEPVEVQKRVKEFMKLYKKELTIWVVNNMVEKAKEELHIK